MLIDKRTFKNGQAWLTIRTNDGEYVGVFHIINPHLVNILQEIPDAELEFKHKGD